MHSQCLPHTCSEPLLVLSSFMMKACIMDYLPLSESQPFLVRFNASVKPCFPSFPSPLLGTPLTVLFSTSTGEQTGKYAGVNGGLGNGYKGEDGEDSDDSEAENLFDRCLKMFTESETASFVLARSRHLFHTFPLSSPRLNALTRISSSGSSPQYFQCNAFLLLFGFRF